MYLTKKGFSNLNKENIRNIKKKFTEHSSPKEDNLLS